jgi:hypothetical protein
MVRIWVWVWDTVGVSGPEFPTSNVLVCLCSVVILRFTVFRLLTDFVCLYTYMSFDFPFGKLFGNFVITLLAASDQFPFHCADDVYLVIHICDEIRLIRYSPLLLIGSPIPIDN